MVNIKNRIKKMESILEDLRPRYEFSSVQSEDEPWTIREVINGEYGRIISSDSEEGKKLIKENLVKYPKNNPIIILDDSKWENLKNSKPKQI